MGMTHYWEREPELPAEAFSGAVKDFKEILRSLQVKLAGADGNGETVLTDEEIIFNGAAGEGCEPFAFRRIRYPMPGRKGGFGYCKTENMPYDTAVRSCLLILKHHLDEHIKVSSDDNKDNWKRTRELCEEKLSYGMAFTLNPS